MCGSMADIQSAKAEIRRGKKKERKKKKPQGKNIMSASATQGSHNKRQDGNIMACPIPYGGHKNTNNVIKFCYKK